MTDKQQSKCAHGVILYGAECINCKRDEKKKEELRKAKKRVKDAAEKIPW